MEKTANQSQAFLPNFVPARNESTLHFALSTLTGTMLISLLAQIAVPIPLSPVPITGQTFGVALIALLWGRKNSTAVMLSYFSLGALGLPVFALGKSGLTLGPTAGYLIGMFLAAAWMGTLADKGWTRTWGRAWLAAFSGSVLVFLCGLLGLSFFVPQNKLLAAGLFPFLPGDFVKTLLASSISFHSNKLLEMKK